MCVSILLDNYHLLCQLWICYNAVRLVSHITSSNLSLVTPLARDNPFLKVLFQIVVKISIWYSLHMKDFLKDVIKLICRALFCFIVSFALGFVLYGQYVYISGGIRLLLFIIIIVGGSITFNIGFGDDK